MAAINPDISDAKNDSCFDPKEHELSENSMRTEQEINDAAIEYFDKVWYVRHKTLPRSSDPQIALKAERAAKEVETKYGNVDKWFPKDDYELGYLHGTLSALRWTTGDDWNFLDT